MKWLLEEEMHLVFRRALPLHATRQVASIAIADCLAFTSAFHRFAPTSEMRHTITSPTSPWYRARSGRTEISLLTRSTTH